MKRYSQLAWTKTSKRLAAVLIPAVLAIAAACGNAEPGTAGSGSSGEGPIKVGVLEDRSGDFALVGIQKYHAAELAIEEINAGGGLLGRQLEMVAPDTQSDNQRYQEMARKLILDDQVDVVMGGFSSASREAIRPIMEQNKMLYFYNNQYEGGVASKYTFATGAVPEHQVVPLIKSMIEQHGPKIYTIAADYNFGQISAQWVRKAAQDFGGEVVGEEFIPLSVSQFSSTISKIQQAKPDVLVTLLVGTPQSSFYEQWAKSGIKGLPMATTVNMAQAYEHKRFQPPALANMFVTATFMEELDTPQAKSFVEKWRAKYPDEPYVGMEAEAQYTGIHLWAEAVRKAGTVEKEAVIAALESGISFDGPAGKVTIDPKTHHTIRDVYLAHADEKHTITFPEKYDAIAADWLSSEKGVDLTQKADNKQYTPLE